MKEEPDRGHHAAPQAAQGPVPRAGQGAIPYLAPGSVPYPARSPAAYAPATAAPAPTSVPDAADDPPAQPVRRDAERLPEGPAAELLLDLRRHDERLLLSARDVRHLAPRVDA
ncbi:hypothetical protein [Streptomyces sp. NPDC093089]|uniref:hypothetical protein n=1 Tax=Streptomyces sp. NPDC093089 TaxID=3366024 RepID=UPI00380543F9